jgi:hypothetical protein
MRVRFTPLFESEEDRKSSRLQEVEGHALYVELPKGFGRKEVMILVDDADHEKCGGFRHMGPTPVLDLMTDNSFVIESADCGLGCKCAAKFVKESR